MAVKFRIPGLQVPASAEGESLAFFNALKERLELMGGERGDPTQRNVTLRELKDAGIVDLRTQNRVTRLVQPREPTSGGTGGSGSAERLDLSLLPVVGLGDADGDLQFLLQGVTTNDRFRLLLIDLLTTFGRLDQESAPQFPWSFQADGYGFEITGPSPTFRLVELSEDSDAEPTRPADEGIWEVVVDNSELGIWLVNDDEDGRTQVARFARTGTNGDVLEILTDEFLFNGEQVLTRGDVRTAEVNVGSSPRLSGRFTLTDARIVSTSRLQISLAPGPYTGKGTRADEAEMYCGIGFAATPGSGSATVYWASPQRVRGNIRINYLIG